jgi:hypothetical protein
MYAHLLVRGRWHFEKILPIFLLIESERNYRKLGPADHFVAGSPALPDILFQKDGVSWVVFATTRSSSVDSIRRRLDFAALCLYSRASFRSASCPDS